jgi:uncharacterized integral membrane protein
MLFLILLSVLLLVVVIFALQNAEAVTIRFLFWQLQSSVALIALAATAVGVLIAKLFGLASRLLRWKRGQPVAGPASPAPVDTVPSATRRRAKVQ